MTASNPPVLLPPFLGCVIGDRIGHAVSLGRQAGRLNAELIHQVMNDAFRPLLGEIEVMLLAADIIGIPLDDGCGGWMFLHEICHLGDIKIILWQNLRPVDIEVDIERHANLDQRFFRSGQLPQARSFQPLQPDVWLPP